MFNLKKRHQALSSLSDELLDIKYELKQAKRYYQNHPEEHTATFSNESVALRHIDQVEALIAKIDDRFWDVRDELSKRKYKKFNRK